MAIPALPARGSQRPPKNLVLGGSLVGTADGLTGTSGTRYRNYRRTFGTADPRIPETSLTLALWEILIGTAGRTAGSSGHLYRNCRWIYRHFRSSFPRDPRLIGTSGMSFPNR